MRNILVTGGARSGKSSFAEQKAQEISSALTYIATAQAFDNEMQERINAHKERREIGNWQLIEEPMDLCGALISSDKEEHGLRLVDCITLWVTNLLFAEHDVKSETLQLIDVLSRQQNPVIMVTNEVGMGIVPENALARKFRDLAGMTNQSIAAIADEVYMTVSGLPMRLK